MRASNEPYQGQEQQQEQQEQHQQAAAKPKSQRQENVPTHIFTPRTYQVSNWTVLFDQLAGGLILGGGGQWCFPWLQLTL